MFSNYSVNFTTDQTSHNTLFMVGYTVTIRPNQTYVYNVTVTYGRLPPNWGTSTAGEKGNETIEEPARSPDTITSWVRAWLPIDVNFNGSEGAGCRFNATAEDMNGVVKWQGDVMNNWAIPDGLGVYPEVSQERVVRLYLTNIGPVDVIATFSWNTEYHYFNKPLFYYGVAGTVIALLYPIMFVVRVVAQFLRRPKDLENTQEKASVQGV